MVRYRPNVEIVLKILECISKSQTKGKALKTHVVQCANLKTTSAERYLEMLKAAGYVVELKQPWGARVITVYELTPLGRERYEWFKTINIELFQLMES